MNGSVVRRWGVRVQKLRVFAYERAVSALSLQRLNFGQLHRHYFSESSKQKSHLQILKVAGLPDLAKEDMAKCS